MEQQIKPSTILHTPSYSSRNNTVKVSTQLSSLYPAASLSSSTSSSLSLSPKKPLFKSTVCANSAQNIPLLDPRRHSTEPSDDAGLLRASIVWFRKDLRLIDNECVTDSNNHSMYVLPVYCFDLDVFVDVENERIRHLRHAIFMINSVWDLRKNLQAKGSDLVVRIGKPESVLVDLANTVGAEALYAHRGFSFDEIKAEEDVERLMIDRGMNVNYYWDTLYDPEDFGFELREFPTVYKKFKEVVQDLEVRKPIPALDRLKPLPSTVEPGKIPTLSDLGFDPSSSRYAKILFEGLEEDIAHGVPLLLLGGETEAIQRLNKLTAKCQRQPLIGSQMVPWVLNGCVSPRYMFHEIEKSARLISDADTALSNSIKDLIDGMKMNEYFGFCSKQYHCATEWEAVKQMEHLALSGSDRQTESCAITPEKLLCATDLQFEPKEEDLEFLQRVDRLLKASRREH